MMHSTFTRRLSHRQWLAMSIAGAQRPSAKMVTEGLFGGDTPRRRDAKLQ